jgi:hypothetical protein
LRSRRLFLATALSAISGELLRSESAAAEGPQATLAAAGLVRQGGSLWVLPAERRLRSQLNDLPTLRDAITVLDREVAERARQNREIYESSQPTIESLKQAIARLPANDAKRRPLERQLAAEQARSTPPDRLAGRRDVRNLLVQLSQQRTTLTLRLLSARRTIPELRAEYGRLAMDEGIAQALAELGTGNRLGPARPLEPELRRLVESETIAFTPYVPIWLQSGRFRLTAIIDERQPLTLSWNEYPGQGLILTASAAQALDVRPSAKEESRDLDIEKGRKVRATRATVSSLRLAQAMVEDVPAWVLAPEGEDLGSQIDSTALEGYVARCEPAALRFTLQPRE